MRVIFDCPNCHKRIRPGDRLELVAAELGGGPHEPFAEVHTTKQGEEGGFAVVLAHTDCKGAKAK